MKKIIFLLLFSTIVSAQENYPFVSAGFDLANATIGSKPTDNKASLDGQLKIGAVYKSVEVYLQYENFAAIDFQQYGVGINYVVYPAYKIDLAFGLEYGSIIREGNSNWLYYGGNIEVRYDFAKKWQIGFQGNYRYRPDIEYLYDTGKTEFRASVMMNIIFKLK